MDSNGLAEHTANSYEFIIVGHTLCEFIVAILGHRSEWSALAPGQGFGGSPDLSRGVAGAPEGKAWSQSINPQAIPSYSKLFRFVPQEASSFH